MSQIDDRPSIIITIGDRDYPVLCGFCRAPVTERVALDGQGEEVGCIGCGHFHDGKYLMKEVIKYFKHHNNENIRAATLKAYTPFGISHLVKKPVHNKTYAFIVAL